MESGPVGEGAVPGDRLPPRAAVPQPAPGRREGETHQEQVRVCATLQFVSYQRNKNNCSYYSSIISTGLAVSVGSVGLVTLISLSRCLLNSVWAAASLAELEVLKERQQNIVPDLMVNPVLTTAEIVSQKPQNASFPDPSSPWTGVKASLPAVVPPPPPSSPTSTTSSTAQSPASTRTTPRDDSYIL